jgi:hypothetical protein
VATSSRSATTRGRSPRPCSTRRCRCRSALAYRSLTVATHAPELRERYGLTRSHRDRALVAGTSHALRRALLPVVPGRVRLLALEGGSEGLPFRLLRTLAA